MWGTFDWPNVRRFALHLRAEVLILSRLLGKRYFSGIDKFFLCYETCTYTLNTPCHTLMTASFQGVQCQAATTDLVHGEVPEPPPLGIPDTLRLPNQDPRELPLQAIQLPQLLFIQAVCTLFFAKPQCQRNSFNTYLKIHCGEDSKHLVVSVFYVQQIIIYF